MSLTIWYGVHRSATSGVWVHEDASIPVKAGDTINFWILVFVNGGGYQKTDQSGERREERLSDERRVVMLKSLLLRHISSQRSRLLKLPLP